MEYVIRFAISLFDLAVFMYYFHSNKKMKPVSKVWIWAGFTIAAIIWTFISNIKNPYLNLATLLIVLILLSFYYESGMWTRIINIVTFMGIGMLFEPVDLLLLHAMNFHVGESYKYYFCNGNMQLCSWKCDVYSVKIDFKERDADCRLSKRNFGCAGYGIYLYGVELLLCYSFVIGSWQ